MSDTPIKKKRGLKPGQVINRMRPFQKKAIELFRQQALAGEYKPVEETLLAAGYAPESARQISNVMTGIRPHVEPIITELEDHRRAIMEQMKQKVTRATYGELVRGLDVTTKTARLLGGKSTANLAILADRRRELDNLIDHD